jgi:hypothetical protein
VAVVDDGVTDILGLNLGGGAQEATPDQPGRENDDKGTRGAPEDPARARGTPRGAAISGVESLVCR